MKVLENLLYTNDHEWVKVDGDKAYLGITDYAQNALGSIVFVELPDVDSEFDTGDGFGVVESVKAASDLYIPVSGTILEINEDVADNPGLVNESPYENWLICVTLSDKSELDSLLDAASYTELCSKEG